MDYEFIDFAAKAKELGITETMLRAQVLSGKHACFVFVSNQKATGSQERFLPPWSEDEYPWLRWVDFGSPWDKDGYHGAGSGSRRELKKSHSDPIYSLSGWVGLDMNATEIVLTKRTALDLHQQWIWVAGTTDAEIPLRVLGEAEWIPTEGGGYNEVRAIQIEPRDLYFVTQGPQHQPPAEIDARRERSLLRVIRALDAMNGLPKRGAASPVLLQLEQLGFRGPNDDTIRKILDEARALKSDKA